jgi:hypothetical protein
MVRWLNHAMSFAMVFAIIAVFAVKLQCVRCVSNPDRHGIYGLDDIRVRS